MSLTTPLRFGSVRTSSVARRRCVRATVSSRDTSPNWPSTVCLAMKPVGKPDAGNPHVRFDERGGETELRRGLRHQQLAKAAGNSYSPSPKRNRVSPRLYHSSRSLTRRFTAAVRGIAAIGCWFSCYALRSCRSGCLSFSAQIDPTWLFSVDEIATTSLARLTRINCPGDRARNSPCHGSRKFQKFMLLDGYLAGAYQPLSP